MEYKRTVSQHKVARDMVLVAEERVMQAVDKLDPTWQEMLNQANLKVRYSDVIASISRLNSHR